MVLDLHERVYDKMGCSISADGNVLPYTTIVCVFDRGVQFH